MREDAPGRLWHLSGRVNWRVWHLDDEAAFRVVSDSLERARQEFGVVLIANVLMSNHYHLVAQSPPEREFRRLTGRRTSGRHFRRYSRGHSKCTVIGQFMRKWKLAVARQLQEALGIQGHFWDGKHHRRRLVDLWALVTAVAYDHRNPVRAGMVLTPEEYGRSSAGWWATGVPGPVALCTREDFPFCDREEFRSLVLRFQEERRLDDVMTAFAKSPWPIDSPRGRMILERLMSEAGLDPLALRQQCRNLET